MDRDSGHLRQANPHIQSQLPFRGCAPSVLLKIPISAQSLSCAVFVSRVRGALLRGDATADVTSFAGNLVTRFRSPGRCQKEADAQEPTPMPTMNVERTMDTRVVVTPNCAIANRGQTNS